jgi:hypothetical protein
MSKMSSPSFSVDTTLLAHQLQAVNSENVSEETRLQLVMAAKRLLTQLERPEDLITSFAIEVIDQLRYLRAEMRGEANYSQSGPKRMSLRVAVDLSLFHILTSRQSSTVSAHELAALTGVEEELLGTSFAGTNRPN